jgi:hypothetical protein
LARSKSKLYYVMTRMTKSLLALSIAGLASGLFFVSGIINVGNLVALYTALPAGAICFGLFLISLMLEKEATAFDQEQTSEAVSNAASRPGSNDREQAPSKSSSRQFASAKA